MFNIGDIVYTDTDDIVIITAAYIDHHGVAVYEGDRIDGTFIRFTIGG